LFNRKKLDIILRAREQNKAITDVYLSRSDGKRHAAARDLAINRLEIKARKEQQQVTDHFLQRALHQDLHEPRPAVGQQMEVLQEGGNIVSFSHNTATRALVDLETWAKRTERAQSTFGSSAFPMPTPMVTSVQACDGGEYLSFSTLAKVPQDKFFKHSVTSAKSSLGKTEGGTGGTREYSLDDWGLDPGDLWGHWSKKIDPSSQTAYNTLAPNSAFLGMTISDPPRDKWGKMKVGSLVEAPSVLGPKRDSLVLSRPYTGNASANLAR